MAHKSKQRSALEISLIALQSLSWSFALFLVQGHIGKISKMNKYENTNFDATNDCGTQDSEKVPNLKICTLTVWSKRVARVSSGKD